MRTSRLIFCLLFSLACSDTHILTGKFRSTEPVTVVGIDGFSELGVELVLGHFGAEVAGVIWFYNKDFTSKVEPTSAFCKCRHLIDGRFDGHTLTFKIESPSPCTTSDSHEYLKARLEIRDENELSGPIGLASQDLSMIDHGWTFKRYSGQYGGEPSSEDKTCTEDPGK